MREMRCTPGPWSSYPYLNRPSNSVCGLGSGVGIGGRSLGHETVLRSTTLTCKTRPLRRVVVGRDEHLQVHSMSPKFGLVVGVRVTIFPVGGDCLVFKGLGVTHVPCVCVCPYVCEGSWSDQFQGVNTQDELSNTEDFVSRNMEFPGEFTG